MTDDTIDLGRVRLRRAAPPSRRWRWLMPLRWHQRNKETPRALIVERRIYSPPGEPPKYSVKARIPDVLGHTEVPGHGDQTIWVTPDEDWARMREATQA